jgi:hypothetical protein
MPSELMRQVLGLIQAIKDLRLAGVLEPPTRQIANAIVLEVKRKYPYDRVFPAFAVDESTTYEALLPMLTIIKQYFEGI